MICNYMYVHIVATYILAMYATEVIHVKTVVSWMQTYRYVVCQCILLCRYVDSNVGVQFGPDVFADNPGLIVM